MVERNMRLEQTEQQGEGVLGEMRGEGSTQTMVATWDFTLSLMEDITEL